MRGPAHRPSLRVLVKKIFRDRNGRVTDATALRSPLELGDVLWYLAELCTQLGVSLDDIAAANLKKLEDRTARGKLAGDGDDR